MTLATLCICNLAVLGLFTFFIFGNKVAHGHVSRKTEESSVPRSPNTEDEAEMEERVRNFKATEKAFSEMMNFNIDKAYGIDTISGE